MATIQIPYNYAPRSYHRRIYRAWQAGVRHLCLVMHRRSGKTESVVSYLPQPMLQRKGNYAHVFPEVKQAKQIVWDGISGAKLRYIDHFPAPLRYGLPNKSELKITLRDTAEQAEAGSTYQLFGTDYNINALVGGGTVGIVWDEYSLQNPMARDYARPILAENDGWEVVIFTPRGENHGYDLYNYARSQPDWHVEYLTVDATRRDGPGEDGGPVITDAAIDAHRKELEARGVEGAAALIDQEYYLAWHAPMPGAYYARELTLMEQEGRIGHVPYNPQYPVMTAWDLGRNDTNVVWFFQVIGETVCFIDCLWDSSVALLPDKTRAQERSWIGLVRSKPYVYDHSKLMPPLTKDVYEVHYGPHDLMVHEYSSNKTRYGMALEHGFRFIVLPHPGPGGLADGIATTRRLLRRAVFDQTACARGLSALRSYRREYNEATMTYSDTPKHDHASNFADALRYAAVGLMPSPQPPKPGPPPGSFASIAAEYDRARRSGRRMRPWAAGGPHA